MPLSSKDYGERYNSIYNHGYGTPAGTQGINCCHRLFPYVPGVSINHQPQYDPKEAIKNGKLVQKQRARERAIRDAKHRLATAEELGDKDMQNKAKTLIRARQSKMRDFIKETNAGHKTPVLTRDYSREKAIGTHEKQKGYVNQYRAKELARLKKTYGSHGFPKTTQEYQSLLYNKNTGQAMHAYVQARKQHTVEPVVNYKDYTRTQQRLDKEVVGVQTSTGQVIESYSDHTFDRIFGIRKDPKGKRRIGVSVDEMKDMLRSDRVRYSDKRHTTKYRTKRGYVVVNDKGSIITVVPRR